MKTERVQQISQSRNVVVFYQDSLSRNAAVHFCDQLVERFWLDCELKIYWAAFSELNADSRNGSIGKRAAVADLLIFAAPRRAGFSKEFTNWVETALASRGGHEGIIVGLLDDPDSFALESDRDKFLRRIAHRFSMDYWTRIPHQLSRVIPDSLDSYSARANRVTNVLDEILRRDVSRLQI